jgi:hypothetical protein
MITFYDRYLLANSCPQLYSEAGLKENMFFALLSLALTGFDIGAINLISERTGVPVIELKQKVSLKESDPIYKEMEDLLKKRQEDSRVNNYVEKAEKLADEAKAEADKPIGKPQSASPRTGCDITDAMVKAVIAVEGAAANYVGKAGDTGVMQILPSTWEEINQKYYDGRYPYAKWAKNRDINIKFGKRYLGMIRAFLLSNKSKLKGDLQFLIFAAYNGGIGNIQRMQFDPEQIKVKMPRVYDYAERASNLSGG